ncbi:MAG: hypothetical protein ACKOQ7_10090, partial [Actinomycetota bacterium]
GASGGVGAQTVPDPTIHYTFDSDLLDSKGGSTLTLMPACPADPCNSAHSFGSDADGKYWTWTSTSTLAGGGFSILTNSVIGENDTIALKFSFSPVSGWRKIIDYQNRTTDEGFYYYDGRMQYYPGRTGSVVYPVNTVLDLVIVRDNGGTPSPTFSDDTFTVYGVGSNNVLTQLIQYNDTSGDSIPYATGGKTKLGFFYDDVAYAGEATTSGKVYDLRFWSGSALSTANLTAAATRPAAGTNVVGNPASQSVTVTWTGVTDATTYIASLLGQSCTVSAPTTTCTITGLTDGASGTVQVQAVGPGGYSTPASTSSAVVVGVATTTTAGSTTTTTAAATTTTVSAATSTTLGSSSATSTTTSTVASRALAAAPSGTTTTLPALAATTGAPATSGSGAAAESLPGTGPGLPRQFLAWGLIMIGLGLLVVRPRTRRI